MAIEHSLLERACAGFHDRFASHRHSALLASIVVAIAVRPLIGDTAAGAAAFSIAEVLLLFVTLSQLRSVLKQREVTGETISMAVSIYLLLGFAWVFLYAIIFYLNPDSFGGLALAKSGYPVAVRHLFPVLGYFSLTTLSTIGFGDITPLTLQARYAAVAEGITGQFYMAILVARLVSLQMSRTASQEHEK